MSDINAKCLGLVLENGATEEEDEEENEDGGVWFFVNRGGFPINKFTWDRMYKHMGKLHPDGHDILHKVQKRSSLPDVRVTIYLSTTCQQSCPGADPGPGGGGGGVVKVLRRCGLPQRRSS